MPIFEFRCNDCQESFEKLCREGQVVVCPKCDSGNLKKLFSTFGVKSGGKFTSSGSSSCGSCTAPSCNGCSG
ncbi:MAG: zinc ribbon domain-containing protein [Actinobacteria bacterium]|nr:zinc ribbon domain-containing protein [Actinomycetota bacterium]